MQSFACFMTVLALECVRYQSTFVLDKDFSGHVACFFFFFKFSSFISVEDTSLTYPTRVSEQNTETKGQLGR